MMINDSKLTKIVEKNLEDFYWFAKNGRNICTCTVRSIDIDWRDPKTVRRRCEGMGARVHLFIQSDRRGTTVGRSPRAKGTRDIESRFGAALSPRRHIWAVFFGTGCLIWYRREPLCERGLVLRRIGAAGPTDVTRSSSFRYKSQFYTSLSTDRKTSPYMAEQYDSFADPQQPRACGTVHVFHTDRYTVIIITNGWFLILTKFDQRGIFQFLFSSLSFNSSYILVLFFGL